MNIKRCVLILAVLLLTSCTKLGYNMADWWVGWSLRSYVKLDDQQRRQLKKQIKSLHNWHRHTQLPLYADFLDSLKALPVKPDLSANDIETKAITIQKMLEQTARQATDPLADMMLSLSDKQVKQLLANIDDKLEEYREDFIAPPPEERNENRVDFVTDLVDSWAGRPTKTQHKLIQVWSDNIVAAMAMEIDGRQHWRDKMAETLPLRKQQPEAIRKLASDLLVPPAEHLDEQERTRVRNNQQFSYQLIADLMRSFNPKQRKHFAKEIDELSQDLRELAQQNN